MSNSPPKSPLLTLPTELIESILISLAPSCTSSTKLPIATALPSSSSLPTGSPATSQSTQSSHRSEATFILHPSSTIVLAHTLISLSLTCKQLHRVLLQPPDGHLWREIYLGIWDDPRRAMSVYGTQGRDVDWEALFRARAQAAEYILSRTSPYFPAASSSSSSPNALTSALTALLDTVHTAHPISPVLTPASAFTPLTNWADFPVVQPQGPGTVEVHVHTYPANAENSDAGGERVNRNGGAGEGDREEEERLEWPLESRNVDWVRGVLECGWPAEVGWRLVDEQSPKEVSMARSGGEGQSREKGKAKDEAKGKGKVKVKVRGGRKRRPATRSRLGAFDREFDESETGQAFWRLVAYTGFLPVAPVKKNAKKLYEDAKGENLVEASANVEGGADGGERETEGVEDDLPELLPVSDSEDEDSGDPSAQNKRARRFARMRVYNLQYLKRERRWGPFLPVAETPSTPKGKGKARARETDRDGDPVMYLRSGEDEDGEGMLVLDADGEGEGDDEHRVVVRVRIGGVEGEMIELEREVEQDDDDNDDNKNEHDHRNEDGGHLRHEFDDEFEDDSSDSTYQPGNDTEGAEDEDDNSSATSLLFPLLSNSPTPSLSRLPVPRELRPDWAYLAAVRLVVEANLREAVGEGVVRGLGDLEGVRGRMGRRIVGWGAGAGGGIDREERERVEGECEGWDWAGVGGAWRRCVCWMDYRDLILNNLHAPASRYNSPELQEAMRIIPLQLHISHYTVNAEFPERPNIHVEGQAAGPDHTMRRVWGTVGMIGSGNQGEVRWNLIHCRRDGNTWQDEWAMEGVQVGAVGSAMGVLGMWTGARHERTDPLGPSWMWKVMA